MNGVEAVRRQSNTAKVLEVFRASPRQWINWTVFADLVGERAYRTRISNAKKVIVKDGGTLESRTYTSGRRIVTEYRFIPQPSVDRAAAGAQAPPEQPDLF